MGGGCEYTIVKGVGCRNTMVKGIGCGNTMVNGSEKWKMFDQSNILFDWSSLE